VPRIFQVNWFRKGADGRFLWPGFGENSRVLEWMFERIEGKAPAAETPIGLVPVEGGLNVEGLDISEAALEELFRIDTEGLLSDAESAAEYFAEFGGRVPEELTTEIAALRERLSK